ncbi:MULTISPECIES: hypothetical protein [Flavobacterium]|jgi:hypothetical protein|uniref:Uncharacterized protein n=1 Tax=Flavobacterium cupriresistens TaxID=2893885 RepID=A0ABU4RHZ1_9FLAO|nr:MULTISPECIES: hypothetical protein [unclassified Flavobacterium]KLT69509.1 hypothetical protein AB674_11180 [Flavobacterium sp. ABG]MDX6191568.1 hypothetical protein [Flavobacterium sp. Fl-318]UFH43330.1 hypothetical protein LNP23_03725 [Flavobacterium sp. F-323]
MKKAALTIGLLSLVMVVTSFTTPDEVNNAADTDVNIINPIDGTSMGRRKSDVNGHEMQMNVNANQSGSFTTDNQSTRANVKLD